MYGEIHDAFRVNGILSNFQNDRKNGRRYKKPKKPFDEFLQEEQQKEDTQHVQTSRFDVKF